MSLKAYLRRLIRPAARAQRSGAPGVASLVRRSDDVTAIILRMIVGAAMIPHGLSPLMGLDNSFAGAALAQLGVTPSTALADLIIFLELIGGVCLVAGFLTRIFAAALAAEMGWVTSIFWAEAPRGDAFWEFSSWEFTLMLGCVLFAVTLSGGGRWSIDRLVYAD